MLALVFVSDMESEMEPHVVLLSSPGLGHLTPVLELAKRLATLSNSKVTIFVVPSLSAAESLVIQSFMSLNLCRIILLPPPDISHLVHADAAVVTRIVVIMREIKPAFSSAVSALSVPPTLFIVDLFGYESMDIADQFKIPKFVYIPSHAGFLALTLYLPVLDEVVKGEYVDEKDALFIPGCRPLQLEDVVDPMLCRSDQQYLEYLNMGIKIPMADGILLNTWEELEPATLAALRDDKLWGGISKAPIYPVGPTVTTPNRPIDSNKSEMFLWLDKQPSESVLYISFGSGGILTKEQMRELALGLELSQQSFIWVVRTPVVAKSCDGSFFTVGNDCNDERLASYLPEGFLEWSNNMGLIISDWAPQVEILRHQSVGGFLSHCGWNSTLESITHGVPLIAWPLYAEQRMNATLLVEELKIAVRSKTLPSKEIVGREEIKLMVKRLMVDEEGHAMRARVKQFKLSGEKAWNHNGSSFKALAQLMR
ncbi:hypothetical protein Goarm_006281 [Gossypium armourianum]|uniref:Glycosyltransferase n=1 Tax=Gossypium armourianum TaxID=34283 RepID=A0A7J9JJ63_9ROSI|nr:hypothetical protein [Gossypium armourianum]